MFKALKLIFAVIVIGIILTQPIIAGEISDGQSFTVGNHWATPIKLGEINGVCIKLSSIPSIGSHTYTQDGVSYTVNVVDFDRSGDVESGGHGHGLSDADLAAIDSHTHDPAKSLHYHLFSHEHGSFSDHQHSYYHSSEESKKAEETEDADKPNSQPPGTNPKTPQNPSQGVSVPSSVVEPTEDSKQGRGIQGQSPVVSSGETSQRPTRHNTGFLLSLVSTKIVGYTFENNILYLRIKKISGGWMLSNSFIYINEIGRRTPAFFYGQYHLKDGESVKVGITDDLESYLALSAAGKFFPNGHPHWRYSDGIKVIYSPNTYTFREDTFTVQLRSADDNFVIDTATRADFDKDGMLIEITPSAPRIPYHRKMAGMWATLKKGDSH